MNKYELLFIVSSQYTDVEIEKIKAQVISEVETALGTVVKTENLGKIRLAYPIKKQRHGTYILVYFDAESSVITTLNRKLTLTDEILRHTITARSAEAEKHVFELTSYVVPLSEEARQEREVPHRTPIARQPRRKVEEIALLAPSTTSRSVTLKEESKMSMEELDKKLDEILESDITKNI